MTPVLTDYARRQTVAVDLPPTSNNLFPSLPNGRRVTSKAYAAWQKVAGWQLLPLHRPVVFPCRVELRILGGHDWRDGSDAMNREKAILDALVKHGKLPDDSTRFVTACFITFEPRDVEQTQVLVTLASHA